MRNNKTILAFLLGIMIAVLIPLFLSNHNVANSDSQKSKNLEKTENIEFPTGSVIDVVTDYGAIPDDGIDDTASIQQALDDYADQNRIIYLRNGVYNISNTLVFGGKQRFNTLQGQSETGTIIRLQDRSPLFSNQATEERKPLLKIPPGGSADRFQNEIYNLTFDVGLNNPMADGIWFISNNQGGLRNVTIKSNSSDRGVGLSLASGLNGPMLAKAVTIEGFAQGIHTGNAVNSQTLEDIKLHNQGFAGIYNTQQVVTIRQLNSRQQLPIPVIINGKEPGQAVHWFGLVNLVDSTLEYTGNNSAPFAIKTVGNAYGRNITLKGYENAALMDYAYFKKDAPPEELLPIDHLGITEWTKSYREDSRTNLVSSLFPEKINTSLSLEVRDTPDVTWDSPHQWVNVADFAIGDEESDETAAFQSAIDSMQRGGINEGKSTLYIPGDIKYNLQGIVEVSGPVKRIIGLKGKIQGTTDNVTTGGFRIIDAGATDAPIVRFERLSGFGSNFILEHQSKRTVAVVNTTGIRIDSTGQGDFYLEDVVTRFAKFRSPGQRIWARQLNTEGQGTKITNEGGILWILGLKTEKYGTAIKTLSGGFTEVLGGFVYRVDTTESDDAPMFVTNNSNATFAGIAEMDSTPAQVRNYSNIVAETRGDQTIIGDRDRFFSGRHNSSRILYLHISATKYAPKINHQSP